MTEPTVFIIDDDPSARNGLTNVVQAAGINVESFASAKDFIDSKRIEGPGCIVLDVKMPEVTGPELQEMLIQTDYCMPIIFLSAYGDVPTTANVLKKGAVDFLTKPVDRDVLLEAIRYSITKDAENRIQKEEHFSINQRIKTLTPREYEIMTYVISGLLNKQIAGKLSISEETVKIHRGRVMRKLGIVSITELVRLCEKVGISPVKS
jgi:FixJ family two-component response regulator